MAERGEPGVAQRFLVAAEVGQRPTNAAHCLQWASVASAALVAVMAGREQGQMCDHCITHLPLFVCRRQRRRGHKRYITRRSDTPRWLHWILRLQLIASTFHTGS